MATNNKKNHYEVLKISPLASASAIKKSYQKLVRIHHPDKNLDNPSSADTFKQINEAYQVLSDTFKRKEFDRLMKKEKADWEKKNKPSFSPLYESYHSYSPLTEQAPFPASSAYPQEKPTPPPPPNPLHKSHQGQEAPDPMSSKKKNSFSIKNLKDYFKKPSETLSSDSMYVPLSVSLEEAALGCIKNISLNIRKKGVLKKQSFSASIPPGAKEGQKIKIHNQDKTSSNNLYMSIVYKTHPLFKVENENILMDLPVCFTKAILGGAVELPTLRGRISFQLPAGTQSGHVIQLKNQGLPSLTNTKKRGNMLIKVLIDIPADLSTEDKKWAQSIQDKNLPCPKVAEFNIKTKLLLKRRNKS